MSGRLAGMTAAALLTAGCGGSAAVRPAPQPPALDERPALAALGRLEPGWTRLAPPPARRQSAAFLWTGRGLVIWGGDSRNDAVHHADGAVWDPVTGVWAEIPAAPLSGRSRPAAVWTGRELVVWGGVGPSPRNDGAAYDPAAGAWRLLPPAPLDGRAPVAGVWTGEELLVWGDAGRERTAADGAAYDPAADAWRSLAAAPAALNEATAVWTGTELVVVGAELDGANRAATQSARALAYDPAADAWRRLPDPPLVPQATTAAATPEGEVVAWDYALASATWTRDREDRWRREAPVPLDAAECYPTSAAVTSAVLGWYCGRGAVFEPKARTWTEIAPRAGFDLGPVAAGPVAAGPVAFFAGPGLWAYRPSD